MSKHTCDCPLCQLTRKLVEEVTSGAETNALRDLEAAAFELKGKKWDDCTDDEKFEVAHGCMCQVMKDIEDEDTPDCGTIH